MVEIVCKLSLMEVIKGLFDGLHMIEDCHCAEQNGRRCTTYDAHNYRKQKPCCICCSHVMQGNHEATRV